MCFWTCICLHSSTCVSVCECVHARMYESDRWDSDSHELAGNELLTVLGEESMAEGNKRARLRCHKLVIRSNSALRHSLLAPNVSMFMNWLNRMRG